MRLVFALLFASACSVSVDSNGSAACTADECACADNESCDLDCTGVDNCAAECGADATCNVDCSDASNCGVECQDAASCDVDCGSSSSCAVTCPDTCTVENCTLAGGCAVTCAGGGVATYTGTTATCP